MVWYSGDCGENTPTPVPTLTPPPSSTPIPTIYAETQSTTPQPETGTSKVGTFVALGIGILGLMFLKLKQRFMK
jgi:LPXTG-motif cell wall-anchored protein